MILDAESRLAIGVWLADPRVGLLLVGDAALRERVLALVGEILMAEGIPVVRLGPGVDPAMVPGQRADAVTVVAAPELIATELALVAGAATAVVASASDLDAVHPALGDRCALVVELAHLPARLATWAEDPDLTIGPLPAPAPMIGSSAVVDLADAHGVSSHQVEIGAARIAAVAAGLGLGPDLVTGLLAAAVFEPRSTPVTAPQQASASQPDPGTGEPRDGSPTSAPRHDDTARDTPPDRGDAGAGPSDDSVPDDSMPLPASPPPVLATPRKARRIRSAPSGRGGPTVDHGRGGRAGRVVSHPRPGTSVALAPTLNRVALRAAATGERTAATVDDLRWCHRRRRGGRLTILVVDCSGSMGRDALRRAKALALGLLDRAYQRRDCVAVILVRGRRAHLGLAPTRSLTRVRASLKRLPYGGGTPLASGLLLAADVATAFDPDAVEAVVLTDGRANLGLDPAAPADRDLARADTIRAAAVLRDVTSVRVVHGLGRSGRSGTEAAWLVDALAGTFVRQ